VREHGVLHFTGNPFYIMKGLFSSALPAFGSMGLDNLRSMRQ
jgi:hypothetical protein